MNYNIEVKLVQYEVFEHVDGRIINITMLREHLEQNKIKTRFCGFPLDNATGMLAAHDWDDNKEDRINELLKRIAEEKIPPSLIILGDTDFQKGMWVGVIDGWHTLAILERVSRAMGLDTVKFNAYFLKDADVEPFIVPESQRVGKLRQVPAGKR